MPIVHSIAGIQTSTNGYHGLSAYSALYITIGIAAVVFGLIVFIFIRTSTAARQSADHRSRPSPSYPGGRPVIPKDGDHAPGGARTPS